MTIYEAKLTDLDEVLLMAEAFCQEQGYGVVSYENVRDWVMELMGKKDALILLARHEHQSAGLFIGEVTSHVYNRSRKYAFDWMFYVPPAFRNAGSKHLVQMVQWFEEWAEGRNAESVLFCLTSFAQERLEQFLTKQFGYSRQGVLLKKGL